jgi:hypothetical protein
MTTKTEMEEWWIDAWNDLFDPTTEARGRVGRFASLSRRLLNAVVALGSASRDCGPPDRARSAFLEGAV